MIRSDEGRRPVPRATLRERLEAEVRAAERLRASAEDITRRIVEEARRTEDHVRRIRWVREEQHEDGATGEHD